MKVVRYINQNLIFIGGMVIAVVVIFALALLHSNYRFIPIAIILLAVVAVLTELITQLTRR